MEELRLVEPGVLLWQRFGKTKTIHWKRLFKNKHVVMCSDRAYSVIEQPFLTCRSLLGKNLLKN